jgi:hypothetical protein
MDVRQAIAQAKAYLREVYADEGLTDLGLEETDFDETRGEWLITLGFFRPWNNPRAAAQSALDAIGYPLGAADPRRRTYKVVTISKDGTIRAMKNRQATDAGG